MKIPKKFEPIISGISAAVTIGFLAYLTLNTTAGIWLMFSFGATVFLVFVLYNLETSQPKNIFFGHLILCWSELFLMRLWAYLSIL